MEVDIKSNFKIKISEKFLQCLIDSIIEISLIIVNILIYY